MKFYYRNWQRRGTSLLLALLLCFIISSSVFSQTKTSTEGAPVILGEETLFEVKAKIGSFTPDLRAQIISERLQEYAATDSPDLLPLQRIGFFP